MTEADRHGPLLDLPRDRIAAALAPLGLDRRPWTAQRLTGGRANTSYRIQPAGEPALVLRLFTREPAAARRERDLLAALAGALPVARVLDADLDGGRLDHPYLLLTWIEGRMLADCLPLADAGIAEALAQPLLALRRFGYPSAGLLGPGLAIATPFSVADSVLPYVDARLAGPAGDRLGRASADRLRRRLPAERSRLDALDGGCVLVHGDYNPTNLLLARVGSGWAVTGVLDWEFAYANTPLADLCQLVRERDRLPPGCLDRLAAALGGLPPDWQRIVRIIDLINQCDFLGRPPDQPATIAQARRHMLETLTMLEAGVS